MNCRPTSTTVDLQLISVEKEELLQMALVNHRIKVLPLFLMHLVWRFDADFMAKQVAKAKRKGEVHSNKFWS